jgi:hypothetical protein
MTATNEEIERRKEIALQAIKAALGTEEDEYGATLFVSHHLEEVEDSYWTKHLQEPSPAPARVLDLLILKSHWGDEDDDGIDTFDFTLPGNATNYVVSVRFDDDGQVEEIAMES